MNKELSEMDYLHQIVTLEGKLATCRRKSDRQHLIKELKEWKTNYTIYCSNIDIVQSRPSDYDYITAKVFHLDVNYHPFMTLTDHTEVEYSDIYKDLGEDKITVRYTRTHELGKRYDWMECVIPDGTMKIREGFSREEADEQYKRLLQMQDMIFEIANEGGYREIPYSEEEAKTWTRLKEGGVEV